MIKATLDHTFQNLFSSFGQTLAAVTMTVSMGKVLTEYYFALLMTVICVVIGTFSYIDIIKRKPHLKRRPFHNYVYSAYEGLVENETDKAVNNTMEGQKKLLTSGTPKKKLVNHSFQYSGSTQNLTSLGSPRLGKTIKKSWKCYEKKGCLNLIVISNDTQHFVR